MGHDEPISRGVSFDTEPEWMQKARQAPLRSTWESRNPSPQLAEGCFRSPSLNSES